MKRKTYSKVLSLALVVVMMLGVMSAMFVAFAAETDAKVDAVVALTEDFQTTYKGLLTAKMTEEGEAAFFAMTAAYKALTNAQKLSFPLDKSARLFAWVQAYYAVTGRMTTPPPAGTPYHMQQQLYDEAADVLLGRPAVYIEARKTMQPLQADGLILPNGTVIHTIGNMSILHWENLATNPTQFAAVKSTVLEVNKNILALSKSQDKLNALRLLNPTYMTFSSKTDAGVTSAVSLAITVLARLYIAEGKANPYWEASKVFTSVVPGMANSLEPIKELATLLPKNFKDDALNVTSDNLAALKAWEAKYEKLGDTEKTFISEWKGIVWEFPAGTYLPSKIAVLQNPLQTYTKGISLIGCTDFTTFMKTAQVPGDYNTYLDSSAHLAKVDNTMRVFLSADQLTDFGTIRKEYARIERELDLSEFVVEKIAYPKGASQNRVNAFLDVIGGAVGGLLPTDISGILPYTNESIWSIVSLYPAVYDMILSVAGDAVKNLPLVGLNLTPFQVAENITLDCPAKAKLNVAGADWTALAAPEDGDWGFNNADATPELFRAGLLEALRRLTRTLTHSSKALGITWQNTYPVDRTTKLPTAAFPYGVYETAVIPLFEGLGLGKYLQTSDAFTDNYLANAVVMDRADYFGTIIVDLIVNVFDDLVKDPISFIMNILPRLAASMENNLINDSIDTIIQSATLLISNVPDLALPSIDGAMVEGILQGVVDAIFGTTPAAATKTGETATPVSNFKLPPVDWKLLANLRHPLASTTNVRYFTNAVDFEVASSDVFMVLYRYLFDALADKDNLPAVKATIPTLLAGIEGLPFPAELITPILISALESGDSDGVLVMLLDLLGIAPDPVDPDDPTDPTDKTTPKPEPVNVVPGTPNTGDQGFALALATLTIAGALFVGSRKKKEEIL